MTCRPGARLLAWVALAVLATGCATPLETAGKLGRVIWDPSVPVGHPEDQPSAVRLSLVADEDVNPNSEGEGTPLMFRVMQLKDDSMLMAASYEELEEELEDALGTNYLDHDDFTLLPGQFKNFFLDELDSDARYIGLVAYYAMPDEAQWKKALRVEPRGRDYNLLVHLRRHEADLKDED